MWEVSALSRLAYSSADPRGQVARPDKGPMMYEGHAGEVNSVVFCPSDPLKLISCSDDASLRIWCGMVHHEISY